MMVAFSIAINRPETGVRRSACIRAFLEIWGDSWMALVNYRKKPYKGD